MAHRRRVRLTLRMVGLPTGTVTLLFSDIEGSTRLLSRLGPAYAETLDQQRRLLRAAWATHGGSELGTEGDSFYVVFETATAGVAAAVAAQRELGAAAWAAGEPLRVRIGLHTGAPMVHGDAYVGMDVHRAARIAAAAHGGQVIASETTAALVRGEVELVDLGQHMLKDLPRPERLFQVVADGMGRSFPPVRSRGSVSRLPAFDLPMVGRDADVGTVRRLLEDAGVRLVTIAGPGGTGKTRLAATVAAAVAEQFPDGVHFVGLEEARTEDDVWRIVASVLDVPPDRRTPTRLLDYLGEWHALIVLDNVEQVAGMAGVVARLLGAAPSLRLVATSRGPLRLSTEQEYPLGPLGLPSAASLTDAERSPAVQLFVRSARRVRPTFTLDTTNVDTVVAVCRALDGLPLALELVAAKTRFFSAEALLRRVGTALDLSAGQTDRPERHRTLRATIAWSYELLDERQRTACRCLAVFAGGADLEAAAAVIDAVAEDGEATEATVELVGELADAGLVTVGADDEGEPRISMLNTVRAFAEAELAATSHDAQVRDAAAGYHAERVRLLDWAGGADVRRRNVSWMGREHDNIRQSLEWYLATPDDHPAVEARLRTALHLAASLSFRSLMPRGFYAEARAACEQALARAERLGGTAVAECQVRLALIRVTAHGGKVAEQLVTKARQLLETATPDEWVDEDGLTQLRGHALGCLSLLAHLRGDLDQARALREEAITCSAVPEDRVRSLINLGLLEADSGNQVRALALEKEAAQLAREVGDPYMLLLAEGNVVAFLRALDRLPEMWHAVAGMLPRMVAQGAPDVVASVADEVVLALLADGRTEDAAVLVGASERLLETSGYRPFPRPDYDRAVSEARREAGWSDNVAQGRTRTVEDVLARLTS